MVKIFEISIQTLITNPPHSLNNYRLLMMAFAPRGLGSERVTPIMAYTGRLRLKRVVISQV